MSAGCTTVFFVRFRTGRTCAIGSNQQGTPALFFKQALHALDCVAVNMQQFFDGTQQVYVAAAIVAPPAGTFQRFDLGEAGFPKAQHMLGQAEIIGRLADGAECVRILVHAPLLSIGTCACCVRRLVSKPVDRIAIDPRLQDIRRSEDHDAAGADRRFNPGFGVAANAFSLGPDKK